MLKKTVLITIIVLSLLTYKFPIIVPLDFCLAVFSFYQVHKILMINKQIIDDNVENTNKYITSLLENQKTLSSDIKALKNIVEQHGKKIKNIKGEK